MLSTKTAKFRENYIITTWSLSLSTEITIIQTFNFNPTVRLHGPLSRADSRVGRCCRVFWCWGVLLISITVGQGLTVFAVGVVGILDIFPHLSYLFSFSFFGRRLDTDRNCLKGPLKKYCLKGPFNNNNQPNNASKINTRYHYC